MKRFHYYVEESSLHTWHTFMEQVLSSQQLRCFVALARRLHMGRAAVDLGLTPSALSHSLRSLETDLGCTLIERGVKLLRLTHSGVELLTEAEIVLSQMQGMRKRLEARPEWKQSRLRIAASQSACHYLLPAVLREFVESFRDLRISMDPCSTNEAIQRILQGEADCAVCPQPEDLTGLTAFPIGEDELRFLVPPAHPWTRRGQATQLQLQSIITPERHSDVRGLIASHFEKESFVLEPLIEVGSDEAIKHFIRLGLGVGILPEWTARRELDSGALCSIPLGRRRLRRTWCVLHSARRPNTIAEDLFADLCQSVARDLMGPVRRKKTVLNPQKSGAATAPKAQK
jgi:LysR family transcriptional regulator, low CO2-responsive transcriptional regulator